MYLITSYENAPKDIGRKPDKNRKIYNGMLKDIFLSVHGTEATKTERNKRVREKYVILRDM